MSPTGRVQRLCAATVALLFVAACSPGESPGAGGQTEGETLGFVTTFSIESLDPFESGYWYSPEFGYGELLLQPTPQGSLEPWILESVPEAISPTEWELKLKEGVRFQNGRRLDGEALALLMNDQLKGNESLKATLPGASAESVDATTVRLTTKSPVSYVPSLLADELMFPVYDVRAYKSAKGSDQALLSKGIYTGPYEAESLTSSGLVLKRDEDYWQGRPALAGVEVRFITDPQARILAVQNGEADIALYPPTEVARTLTGQSSAHFVTGETGLSGIRTVMNVGEPPFDDRLVRRAFALGIDYESIANDVMDGLYDVASGIYPSHLPYALSNQTMDTEAAADLLDQAGWQLTDGEIRSKDGKPLEIVLVIYPQQPDFRPIAVALQAQLRRIGMDVKIEQVDDIYAAMAEKTGWHGAILSAGSLGTSNNPVVMLRDYLASYGSYNDGGIDDPRLDSLVEELSQTFDEQEQYQLLREVQEIAVEEAYVVFVGVRRPAAVVSDAWEGYQPHPSNLYVKWQTRPQGDT